MIRRTYPRESPRRPYRPRQRPPSAYALSRLGWLSAPRWLAARLCAPSVVYWDSVWALSPAEAKAVRAWEAARDRLRAAPDYDPLWPPSTSPPNLARLVAAAAEDALRRLEAEALRGWTPRHRESA